MNLVGLHEADSGSPFSTIDDPTISYLHSNIHEGAAPACIKAYGDVDQLVIEEMTIPKPKAGALVHGYEIQRISVFDAVGYAGLTCCRTLSAARLGRHS